MTDESLLQTTLTKEVPTEHRPSDEWIAAKLKVEHEVRTRLAARWRRKVKQVNGGKQPKGYDTQDEVWNHFRPSDELLEHWIKAEGKGESRLDSEHAMNGGERDNGEQAQSSHVGQQEHSSGDAEVAASRDENASKSEAETRSQWSQDATGSAEEDKGARYPSSATASDGKKRLSLFPTMRDGPNQDQR